MAASLRCQRAPYEGPAELGRGKEVFRRPRGRRSPPWWQIARCSLFESGPGPEQILLQGRDRSREGTREPLPNAPQGRPRREVACLILTQVASLSLPLSHSRI